MTRLHFPHSLDQWGSKSRASGTEVRCIVSYQREQGGTVVVVEGHGKNFKTALADADRQLSPGRWVRSCISTPGSIYADLQGRNPLTLRKARGEGVIVEIA